MGLLPVLAVILFGMWQIGLVGYTYMLAGHAAREGARELATDPTDDVKKPASTRTSGRAREDLPKAWRKGADVTLPGKKDDVRVRVRVKLDVPVVIPGSRAASRSPPAPTRRSRPRSCRRPSSSRRPRRPTRR